MSRLTRDGTAEPVSRDQILRHARGQRNIIFSVQLTTSRIGNLTRLIHTLLYVMTICDDHANEDTHIHSPPAEGGITEFDSKSNTEGCILSFLAVTYHLWQNSEGTLPRSKSIRQMFLDHTPQEWSREKLFHS